jgi:hypothetical protein
MITPEPESVLLSEDYAFCQIYRDSGGDVYAAPWVRISHAGEHNFAGNFLATLEIQGQAQKAEEVLAEVELEKPTKKKK